MALHGRPAVRAGRDHALASLGAADRLRVRTVLCDRARRAVDERKPRVEETAIECNVALDVTRAELDAALRDAVAARGGGGAAIRVAAASRTRRARVDVDASLTPCGATTRVAA